MPVYQFQHQGIWWSCSELVAYCFFFAATGAFAFSGAALAGEFSCAALAVGAAATGAAGSAGGNTGATAEAVGATGATGATGAATGAAVSPLAAGEVAAGAGVAVNGTIGCGASAGKF